MKNIKDIVIGIFAVIGFAAIATGFTNEVAEEIYPQYPESHVWEMYRTPGDGITYTLNKATGEVRKYNTIANKYNVQIPK
tara:strand:+ start:1163 stop:1402 length:240 start_codon:yes stop_codon:yes gene_type:complete